MLDSHHRVNRPDCGGVPRPSQQGCSSVLERVGQLAIGGDDKFCCTMVVLMTTDQNRVHYQRNLVSSVVFVPQWVSSSKKVIPRRYL